MSKKQKMTAVVFSQEKIAEDIYSMWLKAESAAAEAVPGQFISMYTNDGAKLLPRPISLCEIDKENGALRVVYRVTGENTGTKQFSQMKEGDTLEIMGPLGNGFDLETGREKKALLFGMGLQLCYLILGGLHLNIPGIFFSLFFLPCISPFFVVQIMGYRLGKTTA